MKNTHYLLAALAAFLLPIIAIAQDSTAVNMGSIPGIDGFGSMFVSLTALAAAVLPVTGWLKTHIFKSMNTQGMSWVVSMLLAGIGYALKLGIFASSTPAWAAILAVASGLIANGVANVGIVKFALTVIGAKVKKKEEAK